MLDEKYLIGAQDVDEPTWLPDGEIAEMQNVDDPNDEIDQRQPTSIRTASGGIDFLNGVAEGLEEMGQALLAPAKSPDKAPPKLATIRTKEVPSDKWRGANRRVTALSGTNPIVVASDQRRRILIFNRGLSPPVGNMHAYLSSVSGPVALAPNTFRLLYDAFLYNPLELFTKDDVYAVCEPGAETILDIIEEFDMES